LIDLSTLRKIVEHLVSDLLEPFSGDINILLPLLISLILVIPDDLLVSLRFLLSPFSCWHIFDVIYSIVDEVLWESLRVSIAVITVLVDTILIIVIAIAADCIVHGDWLDHNW